MSTNLKLNSVILGQGATSVVMLHGWGQSLESFRPLAELLSEHFKVHLIDLPGFGASSKPEGVWGVDEYSNCIRDYLTENKISDPIFIGHSFGGRVCVRLVPKLDNKATALILIGAHGLNVSRPTQKSLKIKLISSLRTIVKWIDRNFGTEIFTKKFVPLFASRDYLNSGELRATFVKLVNEDLSEFASQITAATLLIWGENDTEAPPAIGKKYHQLIKNSEYLEFKGKDHFPFNGAGAHLCAFYILNYLKNLQLRKASNG
ncbi:MAG: alpha/beta hydrolase [bacterium]|nr:alpha/beta hydrolase [bacterium]